MRAGGGGVPDNELLVGIAVEEDAAVAAVKHPAIESWRRGDMRDGDGSGDEADATALGGGGERPKVLQEAKDRSCSMECAKAVEEGWAADERR
jgi:hypothetical protein